MTTYRDLPLDEGGNILIVVEDGEGLQKVGFQPLPVRGDLLPRAAWCTTANVTGPFKNTCCISIGYDLYRTENCL